MIRKILFEPFIRKKRTIEEDFRVKVKESS
jgi:hypothetical protein